eukprot:scaffold122494_cov54-Cyclotella_meneghiniana.AAC.1
MKQQEAREERILSMLGLPLEYTSAISPSVRLALCDWAYKIAAFWTEFTDQIPIEWIEVPRLDLVSQ